MKLSKIAQQKENVLPIGEEVRLRISGFKGVKGLLIGVKGKTLLIVDDDGDDVDVAAV